MALCSYMANAAVQAGQSANCAEFWLNRYQTLLGAVAAIVAAAIGVSAVIHQTRQTERSGARQLEREGAAARAVLSLALSEICDWAEACGKTFYNHAGGRRTPLEIPPFPEGTVKVFQECIRTSGIDRNALIDLIQHIQVFRARLQDERGSPASTPDRIYDALDLYVRASATFKAARIDFQSTKSDAAAMISAARIFHIDVARYKMLAKRLGIETRQEAEDGED